MTLSGKVLLFAGMACLSWQSVAQLAPDPPTTPSALTLEQARAIALEQNPQLGASEAGWRASQGAARQAGAFLNPSVELRKEDFGGRLPLDERAPQKSVAISQTVRTGGKRGAEKAAAGWAREAAHGDYRRWRLDLLSAVDRQFAELLGAQERERIAAENLATAAEMSRAVRSLVEAGEASPIESSRAENERDLAEIDLRSARSEVAIARGRLAATLGQDGSRFDRAEGALAQEVAVPDEAALLGGIESLPDMARWDAETRRLESSLLLAKRTPWPDLTFSVGLKKYTTTGERAYVAGIAIPLPLFNRNGGGIIEASALLDQGRLERRAEANRLRETMISSRSMLDRAAGEVKELRDRVLPNAEKVYGAVHEGYLRGKFRLLDLLEARRSLASTRLRFVDSLVRLNVAKAEVDRLTPSGSDLYDGANP